MKILLDTNAYVGFKHNPDQVVNMIANAEHIYFSPVVLGELHVWLSQRLQIQRKHGRAEPIHADTRQLNWSRSVSLTADRYSRIASYLKLQGTPIPTNDIWIAAQTMEHGAELITSDKHFENISGLVCTIFER